jgi:dimethylhistidine N-methyltransferase
METATSFDVSTRNNSDTHQELIAGLLADHAFISPKYFYDTVGSVLFEAICVLPEYYPTRTEADIFNRYQSEIAQSIPTGSTLIDLGAGNCEKAARLFSLIHPDQYVPVDISVTHLTDAVRHLQQRFPHIEMTALGRDFSTAWNLPDEIRRDQRLFFYPGSSIGNFQPEVALTFLKQLRAFCDESGDDDGGILVGIDLVKDHAVLNAAYNDALGITSAFNLNALRHINRLLGSDFDVNQWQHHAFFNEEKSRIEMYLETRTELEVKWKNNRRHFIRGERIHTEHSYKYSIPSFLNLLEEAGFGQARCWTDEKEWYAVIHAKVLR